MKIGRNNFGPHCLKFPSGAINSQKEKIVPKVFKLPYFVMIKFYCSTKEREFKQALNYQIVRDCPLELLLIVWLTIGYFLLKRMK